MRRIVKGTEADYDRVPHVAALGSDADDLSHSRSASSTLSQNRRASLYTDELGTHLTHTTASSVHDLDKLARDALFRATFQLPLSEVLLEKHGASFWYSLFILSPLVCSWVVTRLALVGVFPVGVIVTLGILRVRFLSRTTSSRTRLQVGTSLIFIIDL